MYIIRNQDGYFLAKPGLSKCGEWADGREPSYLFRTQYRDEATNQLFETNSKDFSLRLSVVECDTNSKGLPIIPDELLPPPLPIPETPSETVEAVDVELMAAEAETEATALTA